MATAVRGFIAKGDVFDSRFAIFPLAPVTTCIAAGYLLTNRPRVRLFQHHRAKATWVWPNTKAVSGNLKVAGLPSKRSKRRGNIAVCFHLSARIIHSEIPIQRRSLLRIIDVTVTVPDIHWLKSPQQLDALGATASNVFDSLQRYFPNASNWHVFYAGPAPGAVKVGQQLNPTMCPPVQLYEYTRVGPSRYEPSLCLTP
jgi:hypothetical protein